MAAKAGGLQQLLSAGVTRKNNCLFFEPSEFRTPRNLTPLSRYPLNLNTFCVSEVVGTVTAKPAFVCKLHSTR